MKAVYQIGELAQFFGVSTDTIRLYDRMGIIHAGREENNYRSFSRADLIALCYLITLKEADLPLRDIRRMLNQGDIFQSLIELSRWKDVVEQKIQKLHTCQSRIDDYIKNFSKACFHLGSIRYEKDTPILTYPIGENRATMFSAMKAFEKLTVKKTNILAFLIDKDVFLSEEFNDFERAKLNLSVVMSMIDEDRFADTASFPQEDFAVYRHPLCAVGIVSARASKDYSHLVALRDQIAGRHTVAGDAMLRVISVRNSTRKDLDFYELWIPIDPNSSIDL